MLVSDQRTITRSVGLLTKLSKSEASRGAGATSSPTRLPTQGHTGTVEPTHTPDNGPSLRVGLASPAQAKLPVLVRPHRGQADNNEFIVIRISHRLDADKRAFI
ncbi:hypothetical protein [Streptomyces sp. NPDC005181]|uniref:hypothetical protein n=1 Tax=Streptomyces sp. NPDC005181 TaxID=3156869 RepID=UPI0033B4513E